MQPKEFVACVMEQLSEFLRPGQPVHFDLCVGPCREEGVPGMTVSVDHGTSRLRVTVLADEARLHTPEI